VDLGHPIALLVATARSSDLMETQLLAESLVQVEKEVMCCVLYSVASALPLWQWYGLSALSQRLGYADCLGTEHDQPFTCSDAYLNS
jgi:hypothetical protein